MELSKADHDNKLNEMKAQLRVEGQDGEVVVRGPGSVNGADVSISKCSQSRLFVLDHSSQVQVDDCVGSKIFIGPCSGSVFIRDCKKCKIMVACRQVRLRDCHECELLLYCPTQPALELSDDIKIGCWTGAYPGLTEQFKKADLDPSVNTWNKVYDFTPVEGEPHWDTLTQTAGDWWEVPVVNDESGTGVLAPCDNPVLGPAGEKYGAA